MKAWLVTWEWCGDHAKVEDPIAAVLSPRLSEERVREIVELLYVNASYTLAERTAYAKNKRNNPYPARFDSVNGVPWMGRIVCGHNPWLYARLVDEVEVITGDDREESLTWKERPRPHAYASLT